MDHATIDKLFTFHPAQGNQPQRYQLLRDKAKELGHLIINVTPEGPDQSTAIRKLREVVMTANAAIALEDEMIPIQLQSVAASASKLVEQHNRETCVVGREPGERGCMPGCPYED